MDKKTLILGIGSEILRDDGIALKLVNDLKVMLMEPFIHFETTLVGGMDLINIINGYDNLILIDGIKTSKGIPGDIRYISVEEANKTLHIDNFHDVKFTDTINLGQLLGMKVPANISIIAVEISEDKIFSNSLSDVLQIKYPEVLLKVKTRVKEIIQNGVVALSSNMS